MLLQRQIPSLRPLTTAHLAQTMTLLELPSFELRQKIEAELANNPALELIEERRCPTCHRRLPPSGPCPVCSRPRGADPDQPVIFISPQSDFRSYGGVPSGDEMPAEEWMAEVEELPAFVLRQIAAELDPQDRPLAAHILTSLDEDGLLSVPLVEIARYHHVLPSRVERVLQLVQHSEPVGVGSPSPQEALLVQLKILSETSRVPKLASRAVSEGMDLLSKRAYAELGRLLGVSARQAQEIARFISENLNPYPARAHWGDVRHATAPQSVYRDPDVIVSRLREEPETPLVVEIISPFAGRLRVSPMFRQSVNDAPPEKAEEWQTEIEQANLLVKCLQQRDHTLVRLMRRLVVLQREYVLKGDAYLSPVTRARLADELEVHESTISRAVSGKSIQLPNRRIVPLSKFFDRSLHIRTALRQIVEEEKVPLSDTQISKRLKEMGFSVARRTVAKYRSMEGILPARLRHPNTQNT